MSTNRMGLGGLGRVWESVNNVLKKKYPLQNLSLFYMIVIGGYLFAIFGNPRNNAWYVEFGVLGLSLVVAFLLFLVAALYEPRADNLSDVVKTNKAIRNASAQDKVKVQIQSELNKLGGPVSKSDVKEIMDELDKVKIAMRLQEDVISNMEAEHNIKDLSLSQPADIEPELKKISEKLENIESIQDDENKIDKQVEELLKKINEVDEKLGNKE